MTCDCKNVINKTKPKSDAKVEERVRGAQALSVGERKTRVKNPVSNVCCNECMHPIGEEEGGGRGIKSEHLPPPWLGFLSETSEKEPAGTARPVAPQ